MTNAASSLVTAPPWLVVALQEAGNREVPGTGTNPRIARYLQTTHLPAPLNASDETPWCSAFVNWCMGQVGIQGTQSAAARSWEHWGMPADDNPQLGDLAVFWRGSRESGKGHVAFRLRQDGAVVWVWGGNQSNGVCAAPYPMRELIGFRRPGGR